MGTMLRCRSGRKYSHAHCSNRISHEVTWDNEIPVGYNIHIDYLYNTIYIFCVDYINICSKLATSTVRTTQHIMQIENSTVIYTDIT